jgi:hypothetical protein
MAIQFKITARFQILAKQLNLSADMFNERKSSLMSSISATLTAGLVPTPAPAPAANTPAPTTQLPEDSTSISEAAQVSQMSLQGQSPSQIAASLGIPVASVNLDLGIVASSASAG